MSRRIVWALLLALLTGSAPSASAQTTEAELLRRLETLRPVLDEARRDLEDATRRREVEGAARARGTIQLVRVGPLRIATLPDQAELAAELFEEVWRTDFASLDESPALSRQVFTFQWWRTSRAEIHVDLDAPETEGTWVRRVEVSRLWVRTRAGVAVLVRDAIWAALRDDFLAESQMRRWLHETRYEAPGRVYRMFVLDRLRWVDGTPASPEARVHLLWYAVRSGGEGAWRRAIESHDAGPPEILASISGVPMEQLAADWRAELSAARPLVHAGLGRTSWTVLLWLLLLGAFAMRSTRWRLG